MAGLPEFRGRSISQFLPDTVYGPLLAPEFQRIATPELNLNDLSGKFAKVDEAISEYDVFKDSIKRLQFDEDRVRPELDKYNLDPTLANDPYAVARIKQLGQQFKAELNDPTSIIGAAQYNYNAEKEMEKQINEMVKKGRKDGGIDAQTGDALMNDWRRRYRERGGVTDSTGKVQLYEPYTAPAGWVDTVEVANKIINDWKANQYEKGIRVYANPTGTGYIAEGKDGTRIKEITFDEIYQEALPMMKNDKMLMAYFAQEANIKTFGKQTSDLQYDMYDEYGKIVTEADNVISKLDPKKDAKLIAEYEALKNDAIVRQNAVLSKSREEVVNEYVNNQVGKDLIQTAKFAATKGSFKEEQNLMERKLKTDDLFMFRLRQRDEEQKRMEYTSAVTNKRIDPISVATIGQQSVKIQEQLNPLRNNLQNRVVGGHSIDNVISEYEKASTPEQARAVVAKYFNDPKAQEDFATMYGMDRANKALSNRRRMMESGSGFNWDSSAEDAIPIYTSSAPMREFYVKHKADLQKAIREGKTFEQFKQEMIPKLEYIDTPATFGAGSTRVPKYNLYDGIMNGYEGMYNNLADEYNNKLSSFTSKPLEIQFNALEGTGSAKDNYITQLNDGFTKLVTAGDSQLSDLSGAVSGDVTTLLNHAEGKDLSDANDMSTYTDVHAKITTNTYQDGKPVVVITGKNSDGKTIKTVVNLNGQSAKTQAKELVLRTLQGSYTTGANMSDDNRELMKNEQLSLYADLALDGEIWKSGMFELPSAKDGEVAVIKSPNNGSDIFRVEKVHGGYRLTDMSGRNATSTPLYKKIESVKADIGKIAILSEFGDAGYKMLGESK